MICSFLICSYPSPKSKCMGSFCHVWSISITDDECLMIISASYSIFILMRMNKCEWAFWMRRGMEMMNMMSMKWSHLPFPSVVVGLLCPTKAWWFSHFFFRKRDVWEASVVRDESVSAMMAIRKAWWSSVILTLPESCWEWVSVWMDIVDEKRNDSDDDGAHEVISLAFSISCCGPPRSNKSLTICSFPFLQTKCMGRFCSVWCISIRDSGDEESLMIISASYSIFILVWMNKYVSGHCGWGEERKW